MAEEHNTCMRRAAVTAVLESRYDIHRISNLTRIDNGDWNTIFRVRAEDEWIVRLSHNRKRQAQLEFELRLMSSLALRLSYVPQIKRTKDGRLYTDHQGRFCSVFQCMPGDEIPETADAAAAVGRTLGRMHNELLAYSRDHRLVDDLSLIDFDWFSNYFYTGDTLTPEWLHLVVDDDEACYLDEIREGLLYLRNARDRLSAWIAEQQRDELLTECTVHGDFYQRNILWDGKSVTGVIDWDETVTSWLE